MSAITYQQFKQDFQIHKSLGKGNCAEVFLIQKKKTKEMFALKVIKFENFLDFGQCISEVEIIRVIKD